MKINAVNGLKINTALLNNKKLFNKLITPPYIVGTAAIGTAGIILSNFLRDFNKTSDEENYFQLKTDSTTGKHYSPDIFQTAAGKNLFLGNDVLVTAPTGTGKTAIAHYVITKNLKEGKKTFYTTPLKALSSQKFREFCKIYGEENVNILTGDAKLDTDAPITIMTTEVYRNMANPVDNKTKGLPQNLKTVIFDELHYLDDEDRGGVWEQSIMFTPKDVQILSLSATIGNNIEINDWIASTKGKNSVAITPDETYNPNSKKTNESVLINVPTENRHVPLTEEIIRVAADIKYSKTGTKKQMIEARKIAARKSQSIEAKPSDIAYKEITRRLNEENKLPAIYFVYNKKENRHLAKYLSTESELLTTEQEQKEIARIIKEDYIDKGIYLGEGLNTTALLKGYAIHNAGMLPNQKMLIEELFEKKLVKVLIATTTLAAGINMPAKSVVISSPMVAGVLDTPNKISQKKGRAGRRGIDKEGFVFYMSCNPEQTKVYEKLINSKPNNLKSRLILDYSTVANYIANSYNEELLKDVLSRSYYVYDKDNRINKEKLQELIDSYNVKKEILNNEGYIKNNGELSTKGTMIKYLNGYEQIPIINIIADKTLEKLEPKQIAGVLGGLANIEYNTKSDLPRKPFEIRRKDDHAFATAANKVAKAVEKYAIATSKLHPKEDILVDAKSMDHIYTWAELNEKNENSLENWKIIYDNSIKNSKSDEGGLHEEITKTTDLIKQLIGVCRIASGVSEKHHYYYKNMTDKLQAALELIQKEPADERL